VKKKEKENKEETKPKKEKKAKAPKEKKTKDATFLKTALIIAVSTVISALISSGIIFWKAQENITLNNKANKESSLETYTHLVSANAKLFSKDIALVSDIVISRPELFELDQNAIDSINAIAEKNLPEAIDFKIFLLSRYDLDREAYPPVNFATQKQLLAAETEKNIWPYFYKHNKGNYVSVADTIRHPKTGELLYTIMASYPEKSLTGLLPKSALNNTQINILQVFDGDDKNVIYSSGKSSQKKGAELLDTQHPSWKVEYLSNQKAHLFQQVFTLIGIIAGVTILLISIAGFVGVNLLRNNLAADSSLIFEFVRSGNKKSIKPEQFKTDLFIRLYEQIKELNLGKSSVVGASKAGGGKENFDIEIAEGDENLFGSEEAEKEEKAETSAPAAASSESINPGIFRAYDIRGIVDETLTAEGVKLIGQAIGSEAQKQGDQSVIIARDGRLSGPSLSEALKQGILSSGANVIELGMVPTPLLYFACKTLESKSGVMLTGSHNPSNHNGLKIVINGITLANEGIQNLKERIETSELSQGQGEATDYDIMPAYLEALENDVILAQPLDVVIDCGNGVTGVMAEQLFEQIGCNVTPLYTEVDGNFPNHHPDPSQPKNLEALINKVKDTGAHLGVAFDGDGDRVGLVTNTGKIIWPDRLMMLFAKDILMRSPGADIIFDVKCSNTLAETIRKQGGRPLMWRTGHSLIKAKLLETGAQLAGEMSGHIFFNDRWYGFDDGLYSAARLMEILSTDANSCDEIFQQFPEMVSTPEINIPVDDEGKFDMITVLASVGEFGDGNITDIDGIRVDYPDGWGLVRASNTTANLVTRFEAKNEERLTEIKAIFKEQILKIQDDLDIPF
jgi:phosphomannomutase/phosphoglucomutase